MKQKPSIQFYLQDFLSSVDVSIMDVKEVGQYCLLLFYCANNGGEIPNDIDSLTKLCRGEQPTERVLKKFYAVRNADASVLRNERIDFELEKKKKFTQEMKNLALKRWGKPQIPACDTHTGTQCDTQCTSISSFIKKRKKKKEKNLKQNFDGETDRGKDQGFDNFLNHCKQRKIRANISCKKYLELREEYRMKIDWKLEIKKCVNNNYDRGKKVIFSNSIRNWCEISIDIAKKNEIKALQNYEDKKYKTPEKKLPKITPLPEFDEKKRVSQEVLDRVKKEISEKFSFPK